MADTSYFRSPTRRELRDRRLERQESRRAQCKVLGALDAVLKSQSVYQEPEVSLTTDIPAHMLPKPAPKKASAAESVVRKDSQNPAYAQSLKASQRERRPKTAPRPIVSQEQQLPLSWETTHGGKNDTSAVQSKLGYTKGQGEAPAIYTPTAENPRRQIAAQREAREKQKVAAPEKKPAPFEYKPKVTKLENGAQPRVIELVPGPNPGAKRNSGDNGLHGRAFR